MRSKLYVAAMRPVDGHLLLSMMVYADEINPVASIPELDELDEVEVTPRELEMAEALIDSLSADFEPEKYQDTYREELLELIHAKAAGATTKVEAPEAPSDDVVVDLMAALEKSVAAAKEARTRHPTARAPEGRTAGRTSKRAATRSAGRPARRADVAGEVSTPGTTSKRTTPAKKAPATGSRKAAGSRAAAAPREAAGTPKAAAPRKRAAAGKARTRKTA
jgi:DNA end-binding protein Ku